MSTAIFDVPGLPLPVALRRHPQARRLKLRVDHEARQLRLTMPPRASARAALRWAGEQRDWVEGQLRGGPESLPFRDGAVIPFRDETLAIAWTDGRRRAPERRDGRLLLSCPEGSLARTVERWLCAEALRVLSEETARMAAEGGVGVRAVAVGDPASRWGSCTASGSIRYSWRLILAPPECLRFVVAHEVAHRLHMDHSPAFRAAEQRLFGGPVAEARALLRQLGPSLRLVGRAA